MIRIQYPLKYKEPPKKGCDTCRHRDYCKYTLDEYLESYFNLQDCKGYELGVNYLISRIYDEELEDEILELLEINKDKLLADKPLTNQ